MKSLVVYYSHYGNTARLADTLLDALGKRGDASVDEIRYMDNRQSIFKRIFYRFFPVLVRLAPVKTDLKDYDLLCVGIPVWGGRPSAPVTKYLLLTKDAVGKKVICFYVYSLEASAKRCSKFIKSLLKKKGFLCVESVFVHWDNIGNDLFLNKAISEAINKVSSHRA